MKTFPWPMRSALLVLALSAGCADDPCPPPSTTNGESVCDGRLCSAGTHCVRVPGETGGTVGDCRSGCLRSEECQRGLVCARDESGGAGVCLAPSGQCADAALDASIDPGDAGRCACDTTSSCESGCACDDDCTPTCDCDATSACDDSEELPCACDDDCEGGCACDVGAGCDEGCACDARCPAAAGCDNTCRFANDGECDDGGPGSDTAASS